MRGTPPQLPQLPQLPLIALNRLFSRSAHPAGPTPNVLTLKLDGHFEQFAHGW